MLQISMGGRNGIEKRVEKIGLPFCVFGVYVIIVIVVWSWD